MQVTRLEMDTANQPSQEPNLNALAIVPAKRKRGRPRKYPSADDPNFHPGGSKFGRRGSGGNKTHQAGPIHTAKDSRVGQFVSGVIESEFDGGYLLTVKVRNSDITLRGVVFKSGRCDLVTAENDVAPNIPMVHRNEVLRPSDGYSRVSKYRSRGRNRVSNPLLSTSLVALKNKHPAPPPVTTQAIVPFRGNVVATVALQAMQPSDESCQIQTLRNGRDVDASSPEVDVKPMKPPPGTRYGNLMREDEHSKKADAKTGITMEAHRQQQAMFMEPFHSNAVSSPLDSERNGRMTKLLQAVQENAMKNQMH